MKKEKFLTFMAKYHASQLQNFKEQLDQLRDEPEQRVIQTIDRRENQNIYKDSR